jgi:hypothetical protein
MLTFRQKCGPQVASGVERLSHLNVEDGLENKENNSQFKFTFKFFYDRRSVGQSILVSSHHLAPTTIFFLTTETVF